MTPLTDLQARLAAPGHKELRLALCHQLQAMEQRLQHRIAQGLPREDFSVATAMADAALAAREFLKAEAD